MISHRNRETPIPGQAQAPLAAPALAPAPRVLHMLCRGLTRRLLAASLGTGLVIGMSVGLGAPSLQAAEVVGCSLTAQEMYKLEQMGQAFLQQRSRRCLVRMLHGQVGDIVSFKSLGGYIKAKGRIIARSGPYYSIKLTEVQRNIHHSDLVTLKDGTDQNYWAAIQVLND